MAARKASGTKSGGLAVVLSGVAARAAADLGALQALEEAGMKPACVVGVSGGALAGALYCACGGAAAAREALYQTVGQRSWQDLVDIDFEAVASLADRPHETAGFVAGQALHEALVATPIGHQGFQHLTVPLLVLACDLNTGRELVFANQTVDSGPRDYPLFARTAADLDRVNVATACRASMALPGLFQPLTLDHRCLVDGSLRLGRALNVAAAQPKVDRILWLHAGLDENDGFSLVMDYAGQSFAACVAHALAVAGADQFDPHTAAPALAEKTVRYVNLGVSSVGVAELAKTQALYESGRRTLAALLSKEELAGGLFAAGGEAIAGALAGDQDEYDGPRWNVTVGRGGNVVAIADRMPPLQQEFGYEFDAYLEQAGLPRLAAREPIETAAWARRQAEATVGLAKLTGHYLLMTLTYCWKGAALGLKTAWAALALDKVTDSASRAVAEVALTVTDTLRKPVPAAETNGAPAAEQSVQAGDDDGETVDADG